MRAIFESVKNIILIVLAILVILSLYNGILNAKGNIDTSLEQVGKAISGEISIFMQSEKQNEVSFSIYKEINLLTIGLEELKVGTRQTIKEGENSVNSNSFFIPIAVKENVNLFGDRSSLDDFPICIQRIYRLTLDPSIEDKKGEIFQALSNTLDGNEKALTCYYLLNKYPTSQLVAKWFLLFGNKNDPLVDCYIKSPYFACISPLPIKVCNEIGGIPNALSFCAFYNDVYPAEIKKKNSNYVFNLYLSVDNIISQQISNIDTFIENNLFKFASTICSTSTNPYGITTLTKDKNNYYALNEFYCAKLSDITLNQTIKKDFANLISKDIVRFLGNQLFYTLRFAGFVNTLNSIEKVSEIQLNSKCNDFSPTNLLNIQITEYKDSGGTSINIASSIKNDINNLAKRLNDIKNILCNSDWTSQLSNQLNSIIKNTQLRPIINLYLIVKANSIKDSTGNDCTTNAKAKAVNLYYKEKETILSDLGKLIEEINNYSKNVRFLKIALDVNPKCVSLLINQIENSKELSKEEKEKLEDIIYSIYSKLIKNLRDGFCTDINTNLNLLFEDSSYSPIDSYNKIILKLAPTVFNGLSTNQEIQIGDQTYTFTLSISYDNANSKAYLVLDETQPNRVTIVKLNLENCIAK